jgi:hypothetical protein
MKPCTGAPSSILRAPGPGGAGSKLRIGIRADPGANSDQGLQWMILLGGSCPERVYFRTWRRSWPGPLPGRTPSPDAETCKHAWLRR